MTVPAKDAAFVDRMQRIDPDRRAGEGESDRDRAFAKSAQRSGSGNPAKPASMIQALISAEDFKGHPPWKNQVLKKASQEPQAVNGGFGFRRNTDEHG